MDIQPKATGHEKRIKLLLDAVCKKLSFTAMLLADQQGFPVACSGDLKSVGIAAIAPECIRMGQRAVRFGQFSGIRCVTLMLEGGHIMIIKEINIQSQKFIVVIDTKTVPNVINSLFRVLSERIDLILNSHKYYSH
ncbi:MAG: hypothetical protein Q9M28_11665 [Mariprofundaceae bacterium]|nr:hypothetical protein [Mariprofundaceae bacterium]